MTESGKHNQDDRTPREVGRWRRLWPKVKVPVQLIAGQLLGWMLHKWLG